MTLSLEKSPHPWNSNFLSRMIEDLNDEPWASPASADDLRAIQSALRLAANLDYARDERLMWHLMPARLMKIDHLLAVHVCGFEYRDQNGRSARDWSGTSHGWRTSIGTYTRDATQKWTSESDLAGSLALRYVPHLRLDVHIGGAKHGQVRKAHFDKSHPDKNLARKAIPLPDQWPGGVGHFPGIAIVDTFLTAFSMVKDASHRPIIGSDA